MDLQKEDYMDPLCVQCSQPGEIASPQPIHAGRVLERLREYEDRGDWSAAEKHLLYWLAEAEANRDARSQLMLHNELMGYYRKQGIREKAIHHAQQAGALVHQLGMENTITAGTTWVNFGTVLQAFGESEDGLKYFEQARENYEKNLPPEDARLGGLYNNMGLALASCQRYAEARQMFRQALAVMEKQPSGQLEQAITWLNQADALEAEMSPEEAEPLLREHLDRAAELLNDPGLPRDGYYAFVCGKCAPVFGHYGYFREEAELNRRAGLTS